MSFTIGRLSKVDLGNSKINFYEVAIDTIGGLLKDMKNLTNKEAVIMFDIVRRLMHKNENQIELDNDDMEFVKKYIGDIK